MIPTLPIQTLTIIVKIDSLRKGLRLVDEGIPLSLAFVELYNFKNLFLVVAFRKESDDLANDGILDGNVADQHFDDRETELEIVVACGTRRIPCSVFLSIDFFHYLIKGCISG